MNNSRLNEIQKNPALLALIVVIEFILFILIAYRWNPYGIADKYPAQLTLFTLIVIFIQLVMYYFIKEKSTLSNTLYNIELPNIGTFTLKVFATIASIIGIVLLLVGLWWLIKQIDSIHTVVIWLINILIISGVLSIGYLILNRIRQRQEKLNNNNSWSTFLTSILFSIPRLIIELSKYLKEQYNITSNVVWVVLAIEIVLITLRFVIPVIWQKMITHDGVHLQDNPVYLNKKYTLGSFETLHNKNDNNKFKYNYSLSAWFYLNPQPPNTSSAYTKYSNILNYGEKPLVQYNGKKNTIRIQTEIEDGKLVTIYESSNIKYQKWNNIVVNYDGGNMDIFINGKIVGTRKNVVPYMRYENVTIGEEDGIHGGICNVVYYRRVLSMAHINLIYKTLNEKEFPVI